MYIVSSAERRAVGSSHSHEDAFSLPVVSVSE
jgi:hypothetical protein